MIFGIGPPPSDVPARVGTERQDLYLGKAWASNAALRDRLWHARPCTNGRNMGQNDPAGDGAEAERPSGEASSVTMEEFEEMLRQIITSPPKTYEG